MSGERRDPSPGREEGIGARPAAQKVVSADAVARRWAPPREAALVFTNGVFDVLHRGHVRCLEAARGLGDVLVVGVNSDASARRLGKGPGRPVNGEADRAEVVAALQSVDWVVLFDDDTPLRLIETIQPDVLVKGGDYSMQQVVGRELVEARGGRVVLVPFVPGVSTTAIVERIGAAGAESTTTERQHGPR